jgi:hypothetical protein
MKYRDFSFTSTRPRWDKNTRGTGRDDTIGEYRVEGERDDGWLVVVTVEMVGSTNTVELSRCRTCGSAKTRPHDAEAFRREKQDRLSVWREKRWSRDEIDADRFVQNLREKQVGERQGDCTQEELEEEFDRRLIED